MDDPKLAIIGTAGRKEDGQKLNRGSYDRMVNAAAKLINQLRIIPKDLRLFSGGAAWSDHVVVSLALLGAVDPEKVTLYLPCMLSSVGYGGDTDFAVKTANTANYYHQMFSKITGFDSIAELMKLGDMGAILIPGNGSFHARNSDVAKSVGTDGHLLAFTFGSSVNQQPWTIRSFSGDVSASIAGLKDGGTADTWNKCKSQKHHCLLGLTEENNSLI